jgi:hypothetical protein
MKDFIGPKLTGRRRHRVEQRMFRKPLVVLQLEVEGYVPQFNGGPMVDGKFKRWWVDAKPEDVMRESE